MNRRKLLLALAVAALAAVAAYIYFRGRDSTGGEIVIRVIGEDYSPMQGLEKIKEDFTRETGVKVEITRVDAETLRKKYIALCQAGDSGYDVIMGQAFDVGLFAVNHWALDLTEALERPGWRDAELN